MRILGWGQRALWILGGAVLAVPVLLWAVSSSDKQENTREQKEEPKAPQGPEPSCAKAPEPCSGAERESAPDAAETPADEAPHSASDKDPEPEPSPAEMPAGQAPPAQDDDPEPEPSPAERPAGQAPPAQDGDPEPEPSPAEMPAASPMVGEPDSPPPPAPSYPASIWQEAAPLIEDPSGDRRRWVRAQTSFTANVSTARGDMQVDVLNVSPTGVLIRARGSYAESPFMALEEVHIALPDAAEPVPADVLWCRQNSQGYEEAGLQFAGRGSAHYRILVTPILERGGWGPEHYWQRRRHRRLAQEITVEVIDSKQKRWEGQLANIGLGGAAIAFLPIHAVGEQLGLILTTGKRTGKLHIPVVVAAVRGELHHVKHLPMKAGLRKRLEAYLKIQENA